MKNANAKYYLYVVLNPVASLQDVLSKLQSSNHIRKKEYLENGKMVTKQFRTQFLPITIEDSLLIGSVKFETAEEILDNDDNLVIAPKKNKFNFYIGLNPKPYLVVQAEARLARQFVRVVSELLFKDDTRLTRVRFTHGQVVKFLDSNRCILKGGFWATDRPGWTTLGLWGSNIMQPMEMALLNKYLTEHKAIHPQLLDYNNWTIWISRRSGVFSCDDPHNATDFVRFLEKKIMPIAGLTI